MSSLRAIQESFASAVTGDGDEILGLLADDGRQADRFEVHRNNTFASLIAVLQEAYPTVVALLGDDMFRRMASAYIRHEPPRANHLLDYGEGLPVFIGMSEPLSDRPWLSDVAALDWAVNAVYGAPDAETMTPDVLGAIPPETLMETPLPLKPGAVLIQSEWPVHAIRMNPAVADGSSRLAQRSEAVLVIRPGVDVIAVPVAPAEHAFLTALSEERPLGEAAMLALETDPAFDIQGALARHLAGGHFARTPTPQEQGEQS